MTAPISLRALDEGHRAKQAANAAAVQKLVMQLFVKMIDPANIRGTTQAWLQRAILEILKGRQSAILLATGYVHATRRLQVPDAPFFNIPKPDDVPMAKLIRSLTYTGPGKLAVDLAKVPQPMEPDLELSRPGEWERFQREQQQYEQSLKEAPVKAAVSASAAAYKHVADGARDLIDSAVQRDPTASGYIRITKGQPCSFCLMLASRGPVYKEDSFKQSDPRFTGPGHHKVHDGCGCMLRPIYGGKATKNWTDEARRAEDLWLRGKDENGRAPTSYSGNDAINAFARIARKAGLADLNRW